MHPLPLHIGNELVSPRYIILCVWAAFATALFGCSSENELPSTSDGIGKGATDHRRYTDEECLAAVAATRPAQANVLEFGATGKGRVDDQPAIQAAIDSGASSIYLPAGTYRIDSTIKMPNHAQALHGDGHGSQIKTSENIVMLQLGTYVFSGSDDFADRWTYYVEVDGLGFEGTGEGTAIETRALSRGAVRNVSFVGLKTSISVHAKTHWNLFTNLRFEGGHTGIHIVGEGADANYNSTGNIYSNLSGLGMAYAVLHAEGVTFGDISISNVNATGWKPGYAAVHLEGAPAATRLYASRINITNVDFDGTGFAAVHAENCEDINVTGWVRGDGVTNGVVFSGDQINNHAFPPQ